MKTSSKIAIAAAAVGAWLLAKKKGVISGIGSAIRNDFYGAIIESEDGNFKVEFSIIPGSGNVRAEIYQRTASFIDPKNYDPQRMVEWFKWGSEYGRDLRTAAIKAGKIVKAQGGTISFDELGITK